MERLKYIVEDSTIAELLGVQNFTNKESAILELVKNAYDAQASTVSITFSDHSIVIVDDGIGMSKSTIYENWMHVGKSDKGYSLFGVGENDGRVLAGSKGVGRFALARLGESVAVYSVKKGEVPVKWTTDWSESILSRAKVSVTFTFCKKRTGMKCPMQRHNAINEFFDLLQRPGIAEVKRFQNR